MIKRVLLGVAIWLAAVVAFGHVQNTDTGTTNWSFTANSGGLGGEPGHDVQFGVHRFGLYYDTFENMWRLYSITGSDDGRDLTVGHLTGTGFSGPGGGLTGLARQIYFLPESVTTAPEVTARTLVSTSLASANVITTGSSYSVLCYYAMSGSDEGGSPWDTSLVFRVGGDQVATVTRGVDANTVASGVIQLRVTFLGRGTNAPYVVTGVAPASSSGVLFDDTQTANTESGIGFEVSCTGSLDGFVSVTLGSLTIDREN